MMFDHNPSRRGIVQATAAVAGLVLAREAQATTPGEEMALVVQPTRVFKTADPSRERTESWVANVIVQTPDDVQLTPKSMRIDLLRGSQVFKSISCRDDGFQSQTFQAPVQPTLPDGNAPPSPLFWPFVIRVRMCEPIAAGINAMQIAVVALDPQGQQRTATLTLPVAVYAQQTSLLYPFRGKGIILQAGVTNGGHRNRSGQFALDGFGLTDTYAVMSAPGAGDSPSAYAGWGRLLIAPADGTVVRARSDRPDQPDANTSDPRFFSPEFPNGGDVGNHVVIDHGNSEFSMLAHFQAGSVLVRVGDRVRQGDPLGRLGASGDATGPHVHYQLQAGPNWQYADGLPCTFSNVDQQTLVRGTYFEAR